MRTAVCENDTRWDAIVRREPSADDRFLYAVETTGVYCRPGCASRRPNRENVLFFSTCDEAEAAGFRPCKRCRPDRARAEDRHGEAIRRACEMIQESDGGLSLSELATGANFSESQFHRVFKRITGVTPKQYAVALRRERMQRGLVQGGSVTRVIYESGHGSSSRFYENAQETLGMTASEYRNGAPSQRIRFAIAETSLGWLMVAMTERGICAVELGDSTEELEQSLRERFPKAECISDDSELQDLVTSVVSLIETPGEGRELPLDIQGTAFQQRVWSALRGIPSGRTITYAELAKRIGKPGAARAVASACASNRIAVLIPCHRVVRGDGGLGGYRWGLERKRRLIEREASPSEKG